MKKEEFDIIKASGEKRKFSLEKLRRSLKNSGADTQIIEQILNKVRDELYQGISTKEIYNRAFSLLKKKGRHFASKYKLKKAIYELGPNGHPFEHFISAVLKYSGYHTKVGQIVQGKCVTHEVDVIATKNNEAIVVECKFHSEQGRNCNVQIPLYIHSRYNDIKNNWNLIQKTKLTPGWVVTNTRFTEEALKYGNCVGLYLLSWDYPAENALKDRISQTGLYPITASTLLTNEEKVFLLSRKIVLFRQLIENSYFLDHLDISDLRKKKIIDEMKLICTI